MDNRFKFRFWDVQAGVMLDWDCICLTDFNCIRGKENEIPRFGLMYSAFTTPQRFIPMQCTGLKDKNGNLIFEGDIVTIATKYSGNLKGYVYYDLHTLQFKIDIKGYVNRDLIYFVDKYGVIIIGNIYQNPELMEEEE